MMHKAIVQAALHLTAFVFLSRWKARLSLDTWTRQGAKHLAWLAAVSGLINPAFGQFNPNSPSFSSPVLAVMESGGSWILTEADTLPSSLTFLLLAVDRTQVRAVAVLTCRRGSAFGVLELIPPMGMQAALGTIAGPAERPIQLYLSTPHQTTVSGASLDNIAAFIDIPEDKLFLFMDLVARPTFHVHFIDKAFGYEIRATPAAARILQARIDSAQFKSEKGTSRVLDAAEIARMCAASLRTQ